MVLMKLSINGLKDGKNLQQHACGIVMLKVNLFYQRAY